MGERKTDRFLKTTNVFKFGFFFPEFKYKTLDWYFHDQDFADASIAVAQRLLKQGRPSMNNPVQVRAAVFLESSAVLDWILPERDNPDPDYFKQLTGWNSDIGITIPYLIPDNSDRLVHPSLRKYILRCFTKPQGYSALVKRLERIIAEGPNMEAALNWEDENFLDNLVDGDTTQLKVHKETKAEENFSRDEFS